MDAIDDSVSGTNPSTALLSNPEHFVHDHEELWSSMIADLSENQGDHVPVTAPPLHNLEATSTSVFDSERCWISDLPQPGRNNSSSDCWSAASEPGSLNILPEASFKVGNAEGENGNVAEMIIHDQELGNQMEHSLKHIPSCNTHLLSLETNGEDFMFSESDEDEIQSESTVNLKEETFRGNSPIPEVGMVFSSEEEAYKFYISYAKEIGFSVRKGKVWRLSDGTIRKRFFFCSREGYRVKKQSGKTTKYQRKETRTGCEAMVKFTIENGKWVISGFIPTHNHDLEGLPKLMVGSSTNISGAHSMSVTMNKAGILKEAGPANSVGFYSIDCTSFSHDERTSMPQLVDGQSLMNYFRHLQMEDPSFFYSVQVNAENCLTNFFWSDGRSKLDYDYFGDVLIMDKTFRIDAYNMTYATFLGINHHQQYVLFGGAFLLDDSKDSFIWLLRTFLDAMGRRQPKTIFTDGYQAMADAIEAVLPKTHHCCGIWYILQSAKKHLSNCYGQTGFDIIFNECIFDCESEEEFESRWESLLAQYDLHENPWLKTLYTLRRKWCHCFCENIFSAGIQSIQGCQSISHFLHSLTNKIMTPLQLVQQYSKVAEQQRRKELYEDFHGNESAPATILRSNAIEKEAAKIYTCSMFKLFREELLGCLSVAVETIPGDGITTKFRLTDNSNKKEKIVEFDSSESHLTCTCKKYESVGILCVHVLKVLNTRNIFQIPTQYILKRWTKLAKEGMIVDGHEGEIVDDSRSLCLHKSKLMHKAVHVITKSLAVEETGMIVEDSLNMALRKVEDILRTKNTVHLNREVDVHYKDDVADANDIVCVETQQMKSNSVTINQQEASNCSIESQLKKRKHENEVRETKCKSSDNFVAHHHSFKAAAKGGDDKGSRRGASRSYCMGENSRQSAFISHRPPLPSQSTCLQFKDPSRSTGNVQLATQLTREEMQKEISKLRNENQRILKLFVSMRADNSFQQFIKKNKVIQQENLALPCQIKAIRGDNAKLSVVSESLPEHNSEQN